jgi:DNA-binding NtrC family response regulator
MSEQPPSRPEGAGHRVLVIDDEESLRHALAKTLRRAGYVVETAATGREGVDRLRSAGPAGYDAVLTDVRLPDLSGLDVVALLTETSPGTPVVVMTAYGNVEMALEAMKRGARDFLTKPFETTALLEVLSREIAKAGARTGGQSDDARLRVQVERKFAPEGYAQVESEMRRGTAGTAGPSSDAPTSARAAGDASPGEASMPKASEDPVALKDAQRRFEIRYVEDLLVRTGGNVAAAARIAGISRPNMHKKLKVLGVDPARFKRAHRRGRSAGL